MSHLVCCLLALGCFLGQASCFLFSQVSLRAFLLHATKTKDAPSTQVVSRDTVVQHTFPKLPRKLVIGLVAYHELYNTTEIPGDFKVPAEDVDAESWAPALRGYGLGRALYIATRKTPGASGVTVLLNESSAAEAKARTRAKKANAGPVPVEFKLKTQWDPSYNIIGDLKAVIAAQAEQAARQNLSDKLVAGLLIYRRLYNCTELPLRFRIVGKEAAKWPSWYRNYDVGRSLYTAARKLDGAVVTLLDTAACAGTGTGTGTGALVEFRTKPAKVVRSFEAFVECVRQFKAWNNGSLAVSRDYRVPANGSWPTEYWGVKLGDAMTTARRQKSSYSAAMVAQLDALGFVWAPYAHSAEIILESLRTFKRMHGTLDVPREFVVPSEPPFDEPSWGCGLGLQVGNIRYRGDYPEYHEQFKALGLVLDHAGFDTRHWEYVYGALQVFQQVYGDVNVPPGYQVPRCEPWPEELWDLKLGYRAHNIRYRGDFVNTNSEYVGLLDALGFQWARSSATVQVHSPEEDEFEFFDPLQASAASDWTLDYINFNKLR